MATKGKATNTYLYAAIIAALIVGVVLGRLIIPVQPPAFQTTTSSLTTIPPTIPSTTITPTVTVQRNYTNVTIAQTIFTNKTVYIAAPAHNYNYSYLNGCYYISGYYNFSFYAPYAGYLIFNQTNDGQPNNFTTSWFSVDVSKEKPSYAVISPYAIDGCTGESVWGSVAPWVFLSPVDNQTMIIPVTNGTNYVLLFNNNAYNKEGIDNPINVTFSMKYVGFKGYTVGNPYPKLSYNQSISSLPAGIQLTSPEKVLVGHNVSNSAIDGFNVRLVSLGTPTQFGVTPAVVRVYFNGSAIENDTIYPENYGSFNALGNMLKVYVNQTAPSANYTKWAVIQLFK